MADLSAHLTPSEEFAKHLSAMERRIKKKMKQLASRRRTRRLLKKEEFADLVRWLRGAQDHRRIRQVSSPLFDLIRERISGSCRQDNMEVIVYLLDILSKLSLIRLAHRDGLPKEVLESICNSAQSRVVCLAEQFTWKTD